MRVPNFKDADLTKFLVEWDREISSNKDNALSKNQANHSLLLLSPSKIVYEVKVDDAGVLTTTRIAG